MGLDMYIEYSHYIGAEYKHRQVTGSIDITTGTGTDHEKKLDIPLNTVSEIITRVAYWRKANQIHAWITQDTDDDRKVDISGEQLIKLSGICERVIDSLERQELVKTEVEGYGGKMNEVMVYPNKDLAHELLPPQSGFFFGSYEIGEWYLDDLRITVEQLKDIDPEKYYTYIASY